MKPVAIDLFCGLGGWTIGLQAAGFRCIGFDIERHDYPGELVLQDVATLDGAQLAPLRPALIVASPPCQAYSYRAMPWKRAKTLAPPDNALFEACFRIQREASEALRRSVPMVVENVCGAQKWIGRAKWHYGSFYLWGDVPALMPSALQPKNAFVGGGSWFAGSPGQKVTGDNPDGRKVQGFRFDGRGRSFQTASVEGYKGLEGKSWIRDKTKDPRPSHGDSPARKAASARIAMIPRPLAEWIGRVYLP